MTLPRLRRRTPPARRPDRRADMLRGAAVAVVALGTVVSALMARGWQGTIVQQRDERLDRAAASRKATIEGAMASYENALQAARSLWIASDPVSRHEFNAFARSLNLAQRDRGLQGIGWRSVVTDARAVPSVLATLDRSPSSCSCPCTGTSSPGRRRSANGAGSSPAGPPGSSGPGTSSTRP